MLITNKVTLMFRVQRMVVQSLSHVRFSVTPGTVATRLLCPLIFQARIWSGQPFPSPGDLPHPGIESWSPALHTDSLVTELPGKPIILCSAKKENLLINYDRSLSFRIFTSFLFKSSFGQIQRKIAIVYYLCKYRKNKTLLHI